MILVISGAYLPGWKAGGPVRSISNLVAELGTEFEFRIITHDRDHTETAPYPRVPLDTWTQVGAAKVFYGQPRTLGLRRLAGVVASVDAQMVFLNGFFGRLTIRYLVLARFGRLSRVPVLLAPRGDLDLGALGIKTTKKRNYLRLARAARLLSSVEWQASTAVEARGVEAHFNGALTHIAPNLPSRPPTQPALPLPKKPGAVVLAFVSRISPKKNLSFLLDTLADLSGHVRLEIYGPREPGAWEGVASAAASLPSTIQVNYRGGLRPQDIEEALSNAHFFVLPTLGENFGHAIYEALRIGRPVMISDRTPWKGLKRLGAGWDLSLEGRSAWVQALQESIDMDDHCYEAMSYKAHAYALQWFRDADPATRQAAVFKTLLERWGGTTPQASSC